MSLSAYVLIITLFLLLFSLGGFWGVVWIPTRKKDYERIAGLVDWRPGMVFYDLGSGSGEFLFYLAKKHRIECIGVEVSPILYLYSKIRSLFYKEVKIYLGNLFKFNITKADVIYTFLHPEMLKKLKGKIEAEIKQNTLVILSTWPFEDEQPLKISQKDKETPYYLYLIKPKT